MNRITEMDLGEAGLRFVEKSLTKWGGLAEAAVHLPIRQGRAVALVPEGTSLTRATEFRSGYLGDTSAVDDVLVRHILSRRHRESSLVVQDTTSSPTDIYVTDYRAENLKFFHAENVYWFANDNEFSNQSVMDTIQLANGFHTFVFTLSCRVDQERFLNREVSAAVISDFAGHIEEIIIGAYDWESFVIWQPA